MGGDAGGSGEIDLVFEWRQLCHGCGEYKRFNALICETCIDRHDV